MELADSIRQYYLENTSKLKFSNRFHLASRLASWEGDDTAIEILANLKNQILPADLSAELRAILDRPVWKVYAYPQRLPYFTKYPRLFGIHNALFRVRHLLYLYGYDAREELLKLVAQEELEKLRNDMLTDNQAVKYLSRFAVDFIYLYEILFGTESKINPEYFYEIGETYDLSDPVQLHLLVYLYTHCIIADSNFYARVVPAGNNQVYRKMLGKLEGLMDGNESIKLDNKFEFLVASRICGWPAQIADKIYFEAARSLSPQGYIIDKHNEPHHPGLNSFNGSEHRNVLFIMSTSDFKPRKIKIGA